MVWLFCYWAVHAACAHYGVFIHLLQLCRMSNLLYNGCQLLAWLTSVTALLLAKERDAAEQILMAGRLHGNNWRGNQMHETHMDFLTGGLLLVSGPTVAIPRGVVVGVLGVKVVDVVVQVAGLLRLAFPPPPVRPVAVEPRAPAEDDDCPICLEPLRDTSELAYCRACGRPVHADCQSEWASRVVGSERCVVCSADWWGPRAVVEC